MISIEDNLRKKDLWFGTGKGGAYEKAWVSLARKFWASEGAPRFVSGLGMNTNEAGIGSPLEEHWPNFWAAYILLCQKVSKTFLISDSKLTDQGGPEKQEWSISSHKTRKTLKSQQRTRQRILKCSFTCVFSSTDS